VPTPVERDDVLRLAREGAQVVEVLPRESYDRFHVAGALSIPLAELDARQGELDRARPVVLYCNDWL
jgi:rhodanese-related sulfurtransferase